MTDLVMSLHAFFGRKVAKLCGSVNDAFFNENEKNKTCQMTNPARWMARAFESLIFFL